MSAVEREKVRIISPCAKCGLCCIEKNVFITVDELRRIKEYTGMDIDEFAEVYHSPLGVVTILLKKDWYGRCIFLKNSLCSIHEVKPFQCRTYPVIYSPMIAPVEVREGVYVFRCASGNMVVEVDADYFWEETKRRTRYLFEYYSRPPEEIIREIERIASTGGKSGKGSR